MSQNMKTNGESGNALIYVLIAIVLFAALSFTFSRQTDTSEAGGLDAQKAELYATQLITYAANAKQAYDKMDFSGIKLEDIEFTLPSDAAFNTAPTIKKFFHPDGGGFNLEALPDEVAVSSVTDPVPGWYMGRFNDVEWSATHSAAGAGNYEDIILTAYGIKQPVCEDINQKITGDKTIPSIGNALKEVLVPKTVGAITNFSTGANKDLTTDPAATSPVALCPECNNRAALCVENGGIYAFYSVIADR